MKMTLHREGPPIIFVATLFVLAVVAGAAWSMAGSAYFWVVYVLGVLGLVLLGLVVNFFRHPHFPIATNAEHILAPCNGKVVVIEETDEPLYFKHKVLQISIFMSPLDVHVNRNPVGGVIRFMKYYPGKYLVAWHPKSSTQNEQTYIVVESPNGLVGYKQIAGAVARRIKWYVKAGDVVAQGAEFGFIRFGSRVDVLLPLGTRVVCNIGDVVKGGRTVLATFRKERG